jgi:tetratricopeptide (TPR) repeat protein
MIRPIPLPWFLLALLLIVLASQLSAREQVPTVRPWTFQKLEEAEALMADEKYAEALQLLGDIGPEIDDAPYEVALVKRMQAGIHAIQEDYPSAARALKQALDSGALPEQVNNQAVVELAQLYGALHENRKVIALLQPILEAMNQAPPRAYILLGSAHAQLKQYRKALAATKRAVALSEQVPEGWYQLLLGLYFELQEFRTAADVLEQLVRHYPDKENYWRQLVAVRTQSQEIDKALATTELAYRRGFLVGRGDLLHQAQLCLYLGVPYKAGDLLEREIAAGRLPADRERWELTANAWLQAKEWDKAVTALGKAAAESEDGRNHLRLARLHIEREAWKPAATALNEALRRGGLTEPGSAYLLLGIAYYESARRQQASEAFEQAYRYEKVRENARQWLAYLSDN